MLKTDPGLRRIETLYDLFQADAARTEAGLPDNWVTQACRSIRSRSWYVSTPVSELDQRLRVLPWSYSLLETDKPRKAVSEDQREARAANMKKARDAKAKYAAPYFAPCVAPYGETFEQAGANQDALPELTTV